MLLTTELEILYFSGLTFVLFLWFVVNVLARESSQLKVNKLLNTCVTKESSPNFAFNIKRV